MWLRVFIFSLLMGCSQPIEDRQIPSFDHSLVQISKYSQYRECVERSQIEALVDSWCLYLESQGYDSTDSNACLGSFVEHDLN
jgi:hypothetical protein